MQVQPYLTAGQPGKESTNTAISENIWCFTDYQNVKKCVQSRGEKIDWQRFRFILRKEFEVTKAIIFIGFIKENIALYNMLRVAGFFLEFKEVKRQRNGTILGNVDPDLTTFAMDHKTEYDKAILIADDGDYSKMVTSLHQQNKLKVIISSNSLKRTSRIIKEAVGHNMIISIHSLGNKIYKSKN